MTTRKAIAEEFKGRHPGTVSLLKNLAWGHLPIDLQSASQPVGSTGLHMARTLADGPELTAGLRKLVEAKDCFVRARIEQNEIELAKSETSE